MHFKCLYIKIDGEIEKHSRHFDNTTWYNVLLLGCNCRQAHFSGVALASPYLIMHVLGFFLSLPSSWPTNNRLMLGWLVSCSELSSFRFSWTGMVYNFNRCIGLRNSLLRWIENTIIEILSRFSVVFFFRWNLLRIDQGLLHYWAVIQGRLLWSHWGALGGHFSTDLLSQIDTPKYKQIFT